MSRVGKKPVAIPKGVTAKVDGQKVSVKGAKGECFLSFPMRSTSALLTTR